MPLQVLTPADDAHHINKHNFQAPFVCGCRDLGEALRRVAEGAAMIRTKVSKGLIILGSMLQSGCILDSWTCMACKYFLDKHTADPIQDLLTSAHLSSSQREICPDRIVGYRTFFHVIVVGGHKSGFLCSLGLWGVASEFAAVNIDALFLLAS